VIEASRGVGPASPQPKDDFRKIGREVEAIFWRELLKNIRQDSWSGDAEEEGGAGAEGCQEMYHESLADTLAARGALGLEELFRRSAAGPARQDKL
jgi:Rod binding domain-containing protein